jgi:hypothetical protein
MTGIVNDDPYREFEEALTDVLTEGAAQQRRWNALKGPIR